MVLRRLVAGTGVVELGFAARPPRRLWRRLGRLGYGRPARLLPDEWYRHRYALRTPDWGRDVVSVVSTVVALTPGRYARSVRYEVIPAEWEPVDG